MLVALGIAVSALLAAPVVQVAARRNAAMPLEFASKEARELLLLVLGDPAAMLRLRGEVDGEVDVLIQPDMFTNPDMGYAWSVLMSLVDDVGINEYATVVPRQIEGRVKDARIACRDDFSAGLASTVASDVRFGSVLDDLGFVAGPASPVTLRRLVRAASVVFSAQDNQALTTDRAPVEPTGDADCPYVRVVAAPRISRYVAVTLASAVSTGAACLGLASISFLSLASVLATVAVVAAGAVISLVDWDTFYVDFWALGVAAAGFWAFQAVAAGSWARMSTGVIATVAIVVFFEVFNRVFQAIRGKRMGGGDTWIAAFSCGAAAGITGSVMGAIVALVAGCFSMIAYWVLLRVRDGASKDVAVAFGPHLMFGWPAAVALAGFFTI